jgi:phospholipid-binding lipoprotein MlaA
VSNFNSFDQEFLMHFILRSIVHLLCVFSLIFALILSSSGLGFALPLESNVNDPLESPNRIIFEFNIRLDRYVMEPVATAYRDFLPVELKIPMVNLINNLFMPLSFIHAMFIGSAPTLFLGNPFPGRAPIHEDAGQTLGVWGVQPGPYIMLPVLGPSNLRDAAGTIIDVFVDPFGVLASSGASTTRGIGSAVKSRANSLEQVRDLQKNSLDYYAAVRSLYGQYRENEIKNGGMKDIKAAPTIGLENESAPALMKIFDAATK